MMINGYQTELLKIYDNIRASENKALKQRKAEIAEKYPEIIDLDNKIKAFITNGSISNKIR